MRPIKNHDGYFITDNGKVFSEWINKGVHGLVKGDKKRELKNQINNKHGHLKISLGRKNQLLVHRLVYETFAGDIPKGFYVRHLNDVPNDNRIENLAVGTQIDNMQDCIKLGNFAYGEDYKNSKLTWEKVDEIRQLKGKFFHREIAEKYGVGRNNIGKVLSNKIWKIENRPKRSGENKNV